jgi:signal peptidase I
MSAAALTAGCLGAAAMCGLLALRRAFTVVVVAGHSMNPTYRDGDRLLVSCRARRGRRGRRALRGKVVVFRTPEQITARDQRWLVKRVVAVPGDPVPADVQAATGGETVVPPGRFVVLGDNPRSVDSRRFGYVAFDELLGVAARRLDRPRRPLDHGDG